MFGKTTNWKQPNSNLDKCPDRELYHAIVDAEIAARRAHNLCYEDDGHGTGRWLAMQLGKAQNILMHYVVKYAEKHRGHGE